MLSTTVFILILLVPGCSTKEEKTYNLKDECGPINGNILHSIKDESACRIRCRGHCNSLDHEYISSTFIDKGLQCHDCKCTCLIISP